MDIQKYFNDRSTYVFWGILALVVSGALFLFMQFVNELRASKFVGQGIEFRNTITVSGEGETTVIPDTAVFSFAVLHEAKTVAEAQKVVTERMNEILDVLKDEFKIPEKNIKTTSYNLVPRYEFIDTREAATYPYPPSGERQLVGYEVSHWIEVKMKDTEGVGEVVSSIGSLGATNIGSVTFTVEDEDIPRRDARKDAIQDAQKKAEMLAHDLGVRLVKIVNFNEGGGPVYYTRDFAVSEAAFGKGGDVVPPQIPTGENKITAFVTITYAIQ